MYVPVDPQSPTWDRTVKVGFRQWLTSSKKQRQEWYRLRQAAARTQNLVWQAENRERAARRAQRTAAPQVQAGRPRRQRRARSGWFSLEGLELVLLLAPVLTFVAIVIAGIAWYSTR